MTGITKTIKNSAHSNNIHKAKRNELRKPFTKKQMLQHLIHPDYILFDWEFFSNQLEFE